jgi:hypothetical protein
MTKELAALITILAFIFFAVLLPFLSAFFNDKKYLWKSFWSLLLIMGVYIIHVYVFPINRFDRGANFWEIIAKLPFLLCHPLTSLAAASLILYSLDRSVKSFIGSNILRFIFLLVFNTILSVMIMYGSAYTLVYFVKLSVA